MGFKNKKIWITGASSGIGKELCKQLSSQGARIVLSSRSGDVLEKIREELPGGKERHWVVPIDLSSTNKLMITAQAALDEIGEIDILINNGGVSQRATFLETDFSVYQRLIEVNYLAVVALTKIVLPGMTKRGSGTIVSISSVAGKVGSQLRTGYSGSKFAVVGFMDCLRAETKRYGVHCLTVCPGFIQTNIAYNSLTADGRSQNKNDSSIEKGMKVEVCCHKIIKAIQQHKNEVVIGKGFSGIAPIVKRIFPSLISYMTAKKVYR